MTPEEQASNLLYQLSILSDNKLDHQQRISMAIVWVNTIIRCTWKLKSYEKQGFTYVDQETTTEYWLTVKEVLKTIENQ